MRIVVLGSTGSLGKALVAAASGPTGHDVVGVSRRGPVKADVTTGAGLAAAFAGADVVVDATNAQATARETLVEGTRRVLETAAAAGVKHFVGISIVGIDQAPLPYYKTKLAQEQVITTGPVPWSLLRATQFHDLVPRFAAGNKLGIVLLPRGFVIQPIDVREVATVLLVAAAGAPAGRLPDIGGPEVRPFAELARAWARAARKRRIVLSVPMPNATGRFLASGALTTPEHKVGTITFDQWLRETYRA